MIAVTQKMRAIITFLLIRLIHCQDGFSEHDFLRLHQLNNADGQVETFTSYSNNNVQRDTIRNDNPVSSVSVQYQLADDLEKTNDYNRGSHGRSDRRKVFRIKNPFQRQLEPNERHQEEMNVQQDGEAGASNQYAAIQYSLPPEDFVQKMRAENQYYNQYQSTPAPGAGYTATPQPDYYAKSSATGYDSMQNPNQIQQLEQKISQPLTYGSNQNYQYVGPPYDNMQTAPTQVSTFVSTSVSNSQFVGTPASTYVSSSSPIYVSSQPSMQKYVSSPLSMLQSSSPDYDNRVTTTGSSNNYPTNYDSGEQNKRMQIDHYDNAGNGIRYPIGLHQYSNEFPSSTQSSPPSTAYSEGVSDNWANNNNLGINTLAKSMHDISMTQYRGGLISNGQLVQDNRQDSSNQDSVNSETHRAGSIPAANNVFMNYLQPDYQMYNNVKSRTRDIEHDLGQPAIYSNGDYGWKMNDKKIYEGEDSYQVSAYTPRSVNFPQRPENTAVSHMNLFFDASRPQNFNSISKSATETQDGQEFAKAAARAHEQMQMKQQIEKYNAPYYGPNYSATYGSNNGLDPNVLSTYHGSNDRHKNKLFGESSNTYQMTYNNQPELITALPYYFVNKENYETKTKQPFDHAKALKNIVPIDVSNVIGTSDPVSKSNGHLETSNRFNIQNYQKEQLEQNIKQYYKPIADAYYKDKNTGYGYNIKSRPDDLSSPDDLKTLEQNIALYNKQPNQDNSYNMGLTSEKRYAENNGQTNYLPQSGTNYPHNIHQITNSQKPQNDYASVLKFNDIPYRLTQGLSSDSLRLQNDNFDQGPIPSPIPSKINQNVGSHQLDVANSILNKLIQNKQQNNLASLRPEVDIPTNSYLSTINGIKVANPFNVDLKLVAEMLKGKTGVDESQMVPLREQYNRPLPIKLDLSSLQQLLLKNDNFGTVAALTDSYGMMGNPYLDPYSSGRYPYQGVKYSRSQEEEETILPIAESSNTHPIGAVIEQDDGPDAREVVEGTELNMPDEETSPNAIENDSHKHDFSRDQRNKNRHKHPNALFAVRQPFHKRYPKNMLPEPYPLLKPPPEKYTRARSSHAKLEKRGRRRRITSRPKYSRSLKTEALFEAQSNPEEETESSVPILLQPPLSLPEEKSDVKEQRS